MPRPRNPIPIPRCHKGSAVVDVYDGPNRRTVTLGPWASPLPPATQAEYERLLTRLRAGRSPSPHAGVAAERPALAVNELCLAYLKLWDGTRRADRPGGTNPRFALRTLRGLFGRLPVAEFGPKCLKQLRERWVADGLSRKVINGRVGAVRRVFKWGVSEETVPVEVYQRLQAVEGLRAGQTDAPDRAPVRPAVMADVEAALPHMPEVIRALAQLQIHTAARAGELVKLRVGDIDRTDPDVWTYTPPSHKTAWKGKARTVYFGERARAVLAPLLLKAGGPDAFVFSPARAERERNAERSEQRRTPRYPSHMRRNDEKRAGAKRRRAPRDHYTTGTYRRALERACDAAGVPRFTPHRLRHLAATRVRAELGVDAARALCGHTLAAVTEIYSREVDRQLAMSAVKRFG